MNAMVRYNTGRAKVLEGLREMRAALLDAQAGVLMEGGRDAVKAQLTLEDMVQVLSGVNHIAEWAMGIRDDEIRDRMNRTT